MLNVAPATLTLNASASDSDGKISSVALYNGATLLGTDTNSPYSYSWAFVPAGTYTVTSRATDNQGAVKISVPLMVTVKPNVLPSVSLSIPAPGAGFVSPATVGLSANAADSDGTISKVSFYRDGLLLLGTDTVAPFTYNWNMSAGTFSLTAVATDDKGAEQTSAAVTVTVVPNQLPTVAITKPASGANFAAPGAIQFQASAADSDGTITKVEYYNGGTLIGSATIAPYTFNWSSVGIANYGITAKATDNRGVSFP